MTTKHVRVTKRTKQFPTHTVKLVDGKMMCECGRFVVVTTRQIQVQAEWCALRNVHQPYTVECACGALLELCRTGWEVGE